MYSNKENVNILTSLLVAHGVRHAVVCPGSRNAAIVHNLNECEDITCYPVPTNAAPASKLLDFLWLKVISLSWCV